MKTTHSTFQLFLNWLLIDWRSRQGFMTLLSFFRLAAVLAIGLRFFIVENEAPSLGIVSVWTFYFIAALAIYLDVFFHTRYRQLDLLLSYLATVLLDTLLINFFIYQAHNPNSEIFLLLLLPLITTCYYFPRVRAVILSFTITAVYFVTLAVYSFAPVNKFSFGIMLMVFGARALFLLSAAWIYRIQSNFPQSDEKRINSPTMVRKRLENLLRLLKQFVPYDTIAVQLIYRDTLQIVAVAGFENQDDIYQLEYPVNDTRYPNHKVISKRKSLIIDPREFPSFKEERYFANGFRSWLGVPLISPATGECFGMVSIDSYNEKAFTAWHAQKASWFAATISSFIMDAGLGPAALTQAIKRDNLVQFLNKWANLLSTRQMNWEDERDAIKELSLFGRDLFQVEDCSIFFIRRVLDESGDQIPVLHLVASSTIPERFFSEQEMKVTGKKGDGLTGRAVKYNRTINFGAKEIENSLFWGGNTDHLQFMFSKRSRQVLIIPFRDSKKRVQGAIKIENRLAQSNETRFPPTEQQLFAIFVAMTGVIIENIRQKNFIENQRQSVHNLRGILHPAGARPLEKMLETAGPDGMLTVNSKELANVHGMINYSKSVMDGLLAVSPEKFTLENEGLIPAIQNYVSMVSKDMAQFKAICDRIEIESDGVHEELPYKIRKAFFNIAREAIINIIRHSRIETLENGQALIKFNRVGSTYNLSIEDNGQGFNKTEIHKERHSFGLEDMYFQTNSIKGQCESAELTINARKGHGTLIHLTATLHQEV